MPFRSGFVCILGRPNAGKSTLLNLLAPADRAVSSRLGTALCVGVPESEDEGMTNADKVPSLNAKALLRLTRRQKRSAFRLRSAARW